MKASRDEARKFYQSPFVNRCKITFPDTRALDDEIVHFERLVGKLKAKRDESLKETTVECGECGLQFWIRDIDLYQTHWYVSPHGCTGGDYWNSGECNWLCKCGTRNRLIDKSEPQRRLLDLRLLFRSVKDVYDPD